MVRASRVTAWVGWVWFGAIVLVTLGLFNAISGLIAVFSPDTWVGMSEAGLVVLDVSAWGWVHLILGAAIATVGFFLFSGRPWARIVAIVLVVFNALAQFTTLPVTPWWSLVTLTLDVFVLWALIVHGDEVERAARD